MKESIHIYNLENPSIKYSIFELMRIPYTITPSDQSSESSNTSDLPHLGEEMRTVSTSTSFAENPQRSRHTSTWPIVATQSQHSQQQRRSSPPPSTPFVTRSNTFVLAGSKCVTIRVVMPSNFGFRSWRWYETIIETVAIGIYLYATFVLTSLLFLNADKAIAYATVLAICLSVARILTVLF